MFPLREAKHPVAFFANGIGDTILSLPALRALADLFKNRLTLICDRRTASLGFYELPLRQMVEVDVWYTKQGTLTITVNREFNVKKAASRVKDCDVFFSVVPWITDSVRECLACLAPQVSVGFFSDFDIELARDIRRHAADMIFDIPRYVDNSLKLEDYGAPPKFPESAVQAALKLLGMIPPSARVLAVHADTGRDKMWSTTYFVELLNSFLERHPEYIAVVVGQRSQPLDQGKHQARIIPCYGLPLAVSCALVSEADLFIGIDSCMLHVADICRVPIVGLFGPTKIQRWGVRFGPHRHVCGNGTMEEIKPADVLEALEACCKLVRRETGKQRGKGLNSPGHTPFFPCFPSLVKMRLQSEIRSPRPEPELLLCCARTCMDLERAERLKMLLQKDIDWSYVLQKAQLHGIAPLTYLSLDTTCPEAVPKATLDQFRIHFHANALHNFLLTEELLKLLNLLAVQGIRAIPFKGPVLAASVYGNLALREFADLDLLVRERDFLRTQDLLISQGYRLMRGYGWESSFVDAHSRVWVDLHQGITPQAFPFQLDFERLWKRLESVSICGTSVPNFSPEDLLIILCVQLAKDRWEGRTLLIKVCDIAELLRVQQRIDWGRVMDEATTLRSQRILLFGLRLTSDLLGTVLPEKVVQETRASPLVDSLAARARERFFYEKNSFYSDLLNRIRFHFQVQERFQDKLAQFRMVWVKLREWRSIIPSK